jgi:hypothetical protein
MSPSQADELGLGAEAKVRVWIAAVRCNSDLWKDDLSCRELRSSERQHTHLPPRGFNVPRN